MLRCPAVILLQKWIASMAMVIYGLSRAQRCHCDDHELLLSRHQIFVIDLLMIGAVLGSHQWLLKFILRQPAAAPVEARNVVKTGAMNNEVVIG